MRGDRLKHTREFRQLSQQDLADRCGMSLSQLWRYENEKSDPTADVLVKLAQVLEVSLDYLVGLVDQPADHFDSEPLSPIQRRLLWAARNGHIVEALKTLTAMSEMGNEANITSEQPAIDS